MRRAAADTMPESDERLAAYAKGLGHPARVQIVRLLLERDRCLTGAIVDELPLAQSTVSQHLKMLRDAGLIQGEIDGPRVCYRVNPRAVEELASLLDGIRFQCCEPAGTS